MSLPLRALHCNQSGRRATDTAAWMKSHQTDVWETGNRDSRPAPVAQGKTRGLADPSTPHGDSSPWLLCEAG